MSKGEQLARRIQKGTERQDLDVRQGVVMDSNGTVDIVGAPVRFVAPYRPVVGDAVWLIQNGPDWLGLGPLSSFDGMAGRTGNPTFWNPGGALNLNHADMSPPAFPVGMTMMGITGSYSNRPNVIGSTFGNGLLITRKIVDFFFQNHQEYITTSGWKAIRYQTSETAWGPWQHTGSASGSNSNGTWYVNGDQLTCRHMLLVTTANSSTETWTFPRAFSSNPSVTGMAHSTGGRYATLANRTTTNIVIYAREGSGAPATTNTNIELIATGTA